MAETLHVTIVRTLFRYWHAGNGQAGRPLIDTFFPSLIKLQIQQEFQVKTIQDDEQCNVCNVIIQ